MIVESVPVASLPAADVLKLAQRYDLSVDALVKQHVLYLSDPGVPQRVISAAVLVTHPVALDVAAVGTAIKSPTDEYHEDRGRLVSFSRALRNLADTQREEAIRSFFGPAGY